MFFVRRWRRFDPSVSCCSYLYLSTDFRIQKRYLVNVKLKWVKDRFLDNAVSSSLLLKATCTLVSILGTRPDCCLPIHILNKYRGQLGLPYDLKLATFIRRYPNIFQELYVPDSQGTPVPWYKLTPEALNVYNQEMHLIYEECHVDILHRLQKLLMLTKERLLPLQTIAQLRWDLGLPYGYENTLVVKIPESFEFIKLPDERVGLKLLVWNDNIAVSHLEHRNFKQKEKNGALSFPVSFTRGFGLKRKCMEWLHEWQKLPYTSPYDNASQLDPRTDASEKRIVGVFHELLHLTINKKTERKNVSNLRAPLAMPQKFTKVFERHPGIFYISQKGGLQTVVLREAYDRDRLVEKHPLANIRETYASMMKEGLLDRSRGLYKNERRVILEDESAKSSFGRRRNGDGFESDSEMDCNLLSDYESDEG
ncbi:protein ROOT PRIMORDIUM DEFECTIVE 1 [Dorcoceras hygrometricum]|uniref:Protein ROOT PRIMORDIUM DEFECTIVE 1 n=1 Tax=Dorcoceras hygrometricum TaxID=472368 RepID=A0A2Z7CP03_9LAMI|nr:protein ROOT PRIMORDIUM DEFECTIVE 1 [Dorcoceras hygrometricum]